jgi:MYXO-CTERM domain-containing protein
VDSTPPTRPVIDVPVQNGTVGSARPTFSGTAQNAAGLTVSLRLDNSTTIATNVPVTGGDWTWPWPASPAAILPDGPHVVVATVTDAAGNESPPSEVRAFVVDADAPDEPTILAPAGSFVKRRTFTVAGTAEAKGVVTVAASLFDGSLYQPVQSIDRTVDDTGAWSVDFDVSGSALATNGRSLRVTATVRDGAAPPNTSPVATRNFTLDLLGPTVDIASGPPQRTNARGVVFTFTASEQTSFFECQLDSGSFALCLSPHSVTVTTPGPHELCVQATDLAGNTTDSNDVACRSWTLDEAAPTHPVVTTPSETAAPMDESTPLFEGTAEPGSTIQLYLNGVPLGSDTTPNPVMTTAGGAWSARPATARPSGFYVLTATARDAAGNVSSFSAGRAFTLDRDDPPSPVFTAPAEASHVRTARPKFTGTAEPNSTVILAADGPLALGQASANGNGVWTLDLANSGPNLPEGVRTVTAVARDAAQNTGVSATLTLTVDLTDPTAPVLTWPPAHTLPAPPPRTREAMPVIRGTAEPGAHIAVSIDGVEAGTATADASRNWTFTPLARLSDGAHTVTATARDASGRVGPVSASRAFTVDTTGPGKPVITLPAAHAYVNTLRPRFEGRAEPSSTVTVLVDSNTVPAVTVVAGTATADAQGQWGFQVPEASPLSEGLRSAEAYATDDLGNQGGNSEVTLSFTVDVTAPVAPLVESPADGAPVASTSPVISGRAESGSTVSVFLDGSSVAVGTTTAATTQDGLAGAWSFRVPGPLAQGGHTVRARATDRATNSHTENSISASQSFTVDTLAPNTKILSGPPLVSASTAAKFVVRALVQETTNVDGDVVAFEISRDGRGFIECVLGSSASDCTVQKNTDPLFPLDAYVITLTEPFEVRQDHRVLISARDPAGNRDPTPDAYAWRVVDGVLTIGIKFGPDPITSDNTSTFVFESQRPGAIFTGTMGITDGGTPESFRVVSGQDTITFPVTDGGVPDGGGPVLVDGDYELKVRAVNPDNASDQTGEGLYRWTIDTVRPSAPILNVDGQQDGGTVWVNTSTPTFRGTAEPRSTITILNNSRQVGEAITDDMGKWSLLLATGLTQGEYTTFSARATDRAGNTSGSVAGPEVIIDQTPPTVGVTSGPLSQTNLQIAPFTFSRSELVRSFQCSLDNAPFVVCGTNEDPGKTYNDANLLSEGPHNLALKATDLAGNETVRVVNYTWRVDLTPPIVTIATKPPEQSGSANSRFTFTANETPVTYRCSLDGSGFGECSQTYVPPPQDDGPHVLRVQAQDSAGNSMPAPVEYHWVVDTGAPAAPVLQDPAVGRPVGSTKPVFRGTSEPNSTVTVLVDGVAVATKQVIDGLGRWDVASDVDLTEEGHTVRLVAQDRAGNQSEPSDPVSFVVDVTGPNTVIQSGPESRIRSTSATFVFSSEEGATFECSLNRGAFEPCPADGVFSGLEEGGQSLEVRAMDAAGNPDKTPAVYSWRVYLGSDIRTRGGGLSCSSTQGGSGASLALLGLSGLVLLRARRRRR